MTALRNAAVEVCRFDWSDNDADAVRAIDALRGALTQTATEFWVAYHQAWTAQVGAPDYDKAAWQHVQLRLEKHMRQTESSLTESARQAATPPELRDQFAMFVAPALVAQCSRTTVGTLGSDTVVSTITDADAVARNAYAVADAMLRAREAT